MAGSDDLYEKVVTSLSPIWGPFYALYYIIRLLLHDLFRRKDEE